MRASRVAAAIAAALAAALVPAIAAAQGIQLVGDPHEGLVPDEGAELLAHVDPALPVRCAVAHALLRSAGVTANTAGYRSSATCYR